MNNKESMERQLADSFKELTVSRPLEKITIKEITDKAGVIRPTFYNHFQDKYELIEWIFVTDLLEPMKPLIQAEMNMEAMVLLFTNIEKERAFYLKALKMEGPVTFHSIAVKCVTEALTNILGEMSSGKEPKYKWLTVNVVAAYFAQSMCFAAEEWVTMGMSVSPREMAEAYNYMVTRSLEDVIKEM